jgi:cation diffusion facilitator family transporter
MAMNQHLKKKNIAAGLSVLSNALLILMKIIVGILSGSFSIISEAIHSLIDLFASFIALFSVNMSSRPADHNHPYGHGKIENVSGVIEGILIFIAVYFLA